jgi:hypothetical protein
MEIKITSASLSPAAIANARMTFLVEELNALPSGGKLILAPDLRGKTLLLAVRAIVHSRIESCQIEASFNRATEWAEDLIQPIAVALGTSLRLVKKQIDANSQQVTLQYEFKRQLPVFSREFGIYILSNGQDLTKLKQTLASISVAATLKESVRICVVGPESALTKFRNEEECSFDIIDDQAIYVPGELRFPISKKKNLILELSTERNFIILHDRIRLSHEFLTQILRQDRYFDVYSCRVTSDASTRYLDKFSIRFRSYPTINRAHYYLDYAEDNLDQMVDGGFLVFSRLGIGDMRFNPDLHWGEMEDVDLILRMKMAGRLISFAPENSVRSEATGHFSLREDSWIDRVAKIRLKRDPFLTKRMNQLKRGLRWLKK